MSTRGKPPAASAASWSPRCWRTLAREFRLAVLRLCQAQLGTGEVVGAEQEAVLAWLRVEPVALRALRSASIYSRIGRHNVRALLHSLAAWRQRTSGSGLVIDVDLDRLAVVRRPPIDQRSGLYYTKASTLDAYEVLRQLIDAADTLRGVLIAVTLRPELVTDEARADCRRGLGAAARRGGTHRPLHAATTRPLLRRAGRLAAS